MRQCLHLDGNDFEVGYKTVKYITQADEIGRFRTESEAVSNDNDDIRTFCIDIVKNDK